MRTVRRLVAIPVLAVAAAWAAVLARPALATAWRRFRTASTPSIGLYDAAASLFLGGYYDEIAADCLSAVAGVPEPAVLEIGPGPGHLAERLLLAAPAVHLTELDIDPEMLAATGGRLGRRGLAARASLVEGDVAAMPFGDAAFDLVVSSLSAHHWPDSAAGFREIRRVLRPGATALVYDLPPSWGHVETGSRGIESAGDAFPEPRVTRVRGLGPVTLVSRVELRRPDA